MTTNTVNPVPARTIIIVGMHRSGTSFLTGSMQNLGVDLIHYSDWNRYNQKGNRENQGAVNINDQVLAHNGGDWLHPPKHLVWTQEHIESAQQFIHQYQGVDIFGFKDPRTLITLEGWRKVIPNCELVGIFRHPSAVIKSLVARGGASPEEALDAWVAYNSRLIKLFLQEPFPILCFDWEEARLFDSLQKISDRLKLPGRTDEAFYTRELRQQSIDKNIRVSLKAKMLYLILKRIANRSLNASEK